MTTALQISTTPRTDTGLVVRQLRQLVDLTQVQFALEIRRVYSNCTMGEQPLTAFAISADAVKSYAAIPQRPHKQLQKNCAQALTGYFDEDV